MTWVGSVLVVDETAIGGEVTRVKPNEHGRYDPMTWHWCWHEVDPDRVGIDLIHRAT
jgi:hypothetical protein